MKHNPRNARLAIEYTKLMNLVSRSKFIQIDPVDVQPGWPPEKYKVTYTCNGIAGIDETDGPISSNFHQVMIYMGREYPSQEPALKWLTPIWHPNIQHEEPFKVCTNNVQNWFPSKSLVDLVVAMGEMVQYKRYHAKWIHPYPLDQMAADWVIRYAEPNEIVGPEKPYDRRPLLRKKGIHHKSQKKLAEETGRIVFGGLKKSAEKVSAPLPPLVTKGTGEPPAPVLQPAPRPTGGGISFGNKRTVPAGQQAPATNAPGTPAPSIPAAAQGQPGGQSAPATHSLEVSKGGDVPKVIPVNKPVFSIGRGDGGAEVDLKLEGDQSVSGLHAILERDETGAFWLTAKGETPIRVNGRLVPRERSVGVDVSDRIEISSFSMRLQ